MVFHTWCTILYGVTYPDVCCTSLCYWSTDCFALINACVLCQTLLSVWSDTFMLSPCALKYSAHWTSSPFCYPFSSFSFWGSNEDFHVYAEQLWYILIDPYISAQHSLSSSPVNIVSKTCHTSHTKLLYFLGCTSIHILFCSACQLPCVTMAASHVQPALSTFFLIPLSVSFLSVLKQYQVFTWGWTCLWMKVCPWPVHWCRPATCLWMEARRPLAHSLSPNTEVPNTQYICYCEEIELIARFLIFLQDLNPQLHSRGSSMRSLNQLFYIPIWRCT